MPRQCLRSREEAIAAEELGTGKVYIQEAVVHFERRGLIIVTEDAIEEWKRQQARGILERARKYRRRTGEIQLEMVNLFETTEDGGREHYWRRFGKLTPAEGVVLLSQWNGRINYGLNEFYRYFDPLHKRHGRKLDQLLWFDLPPRPPDEPSSGDTSLN